MSSAWSKSGLGLSDCVTQRADMHATSGVTGWALGGSGGAILRQANYQSAMSDLQRIQQVSEERARQLSFSQNQSTSIHSTDLPPPWANVTHGSNGDLMWVDLDGYLHRVTGAAAAEYHRVKSTTTTTPNKLLLLTRRRK